MSEAAATSAARLDLSRPWPICSSGSATKPSRSVPNDSDPAEADMTHAYQDGNALAGPFGEIFAVDVTLAQTICANCGRQARVAELHVYTKAPGMIARCAGCEEVVARYARTPNQAWLDLRGTVALAIPMDT